ncbi:hypothetical protein M409DRAFT_54095 [Zasmidium cellare ATCC 36951]|uniref:Ribosome biogenesis protein SLX9 n=1 Tax=Zasmidium cellare ATCC 36951 TaxID=1080233 RepID=A0A6A6CPV2_ZASCE|nr:uncharacterized protein M409DRAFT_54095 [Zasmidium cellare ATCC 36951]KAF2167496.1 hypothetical protein M409DRAFT_54095 [Zasmidium cellare ATCC 36951]
MAPIKPHRRTTRARVTARNNSQRGKYAPPSPSDLAPAPEDPTTTDVEAEVESDEFGFGVGLKLNKKDKRIVRHNTLLNRVREGGVQKNENAGKKRRRPGRKLVTGVADLGDALPELDSDENGEWEGISEDEMVVEGLQKKKRSRRARDGKMEMKSLKHKPGAMKRRDVMEKGERERFGRNLAGLMGGGGEGEKKGGDGEKVGSGSGGQSERWKALRGFIEGTLERDRAFGGK